MSVITARFPGKCAACKAPIVPGQQIEWSKGAPARHQDCTKTEVAPAQVAPVRSFRCQVCKQVCTGTPVRVTADVGGARGRGAVVLGQTTLLWCQGCVNRQNMSRAEGYGHQMAEATSDLARTEWLRKINYLALHPVCFDPERNQDCLHLRCGHGAPRVK